LPQVHRATTDSLYASAKYHPDRVQEGGEKPPLFRDLSEKTFYVLETVVAVAELSGSFYKRSGLRRKPAKRSVMARMLGPIGLLVATREVLNRVLQQPRSFAECKKAVALF
jgi:hypothetical protein